MNEQAAAEKREKWIDAVKNIACVLVVLGHFFQSVVKAEIVPGNDLYQWFNLTIYYFHVPLFFICSGYLYQKHSRVDCAASWARNMKRKALSLGIPYAVFTTVTWVLKKAFSDSVNDQIGGFLYTLLLHPTAPYWYLYALFFIFLVTPTFADRKTAAVGLVVAAGVKTVILGGRKSDAFALSTLLSNEIWFVLGMSICAFSVPLRGKKLQGSLCGLLFLALSIAVYAMNVRGEAVSFALGLLACIAIVLVAADFEERYGKMTEFLTRYTLPIFLMHTLFAAPTRVVLLKIGVANAAVHIVLGLLASFAGPIALAWLMKKTKWLSFLLYPSSYIRVK